MRDPRVVFGFWWLVYAGLAVVARVFTADGSAALALVWPAAGAAVLWTLTCPDRRLRLLSLATMAATATVVMLATGSGWEAAVAVAVSALAQTAACVLLLRRLTPDLLGAGGGASAHDVRTLTLGVLTIVLATLLGAVVGAAATWAFGLDVAGAGVLDWWARHLTGLLLVGSVGHLCWEALSRRTTSQIESLPGHVELAAMTVVTSAAYAVVFSDEVTTLPFVLVVLAVWAGLRLPTWGAAVHSALCGTYAVGATIAGYGPFAAIEPARSAAFVTQTFVLTVLLTALAVAVGRDERTALVHQLEGERAATESRAELLDAMTDSMTEGLVVVDHTGHLVRSNRAAREILHLTETGYRDDTAEYRCYRYDGTELPLAELPSERARLERRVVAGDVVLQRRDGSRRVLAVHAVPLVAGNEDGPVSAVVVYRDVTEERGAQDRLSEFAATVAHDLRNPLTSTRGWIETAADLAVSVPAGRVYDGLEMSLTHAGDAADRMNALIGDLLARAGGAPPRPRAVVLAGPEGLLMRIARELDCADNLVVGDLPAVLVDPELCHQLFTNLVGNALKYVPPGRRPRVEILGEKSGGCVTLRVADNGIGVPVADRERIFERGHRSAWSADEFDGTGLGLAICRDIAERHHGSIRCEAGRPGGSVFVVELPAAELPLDDAELAPHVA